MGMFRDSNFPLQKVQTHKPRSLLYLHRIVWNSGRLDYRELPNNHPSDVKGENFAKAIENCTILGSLIGKEVENVEDHGCPKVKDLVDEET